MYIWLCELYIKQLYVAHILFSMKEESKLSRRCTRNTLRRKTVDSAQQTSRRTLRQWKMKKNSSSNALKGWSER